MKKTSITTRITLWYSLFFALLIIVNITVVALASDSILRSSAEREVQEVAEDVLESIEIREGIAYVDDDERFNYFEDGVAFVIYQNGVFLNGQYPANLTPNIPIQSLVVQRFETVDTAWYIYDMPFAENFTLRAFYNDRGGLGLYSDLITTLAILSPLLFTMAGLGGYLIIKRSFKPIRQINETAEQITRDENFQLRVNKSQTNDEVGRLANTINGMLDTIDASFNREKQFSANVSHELRTPLSVIQAQIEYLESKLSPTDMYQKDFEAIKDQLTWMSKMTEQMLELTRFKSSAPIDLEWVNVPVTMESIREGFQQKIKDKSLTYNTTISPKDLDIQTSLTFFVRILNNVIGNAIKFTPHNGQIDIDIQMVNSAIRCTVTDTGIGMNQTDQTKIFDALYQVDSSRNPQTMSLGVGLTMTKEMIQRLKGTIKVTSAPQAGTTFILEWPVKSRA